MSDQLSPLDIKVILYTKLFGRRKALAFYKHFHKKDPRRCKMLSSILKKYKDEQISQQNNIIANSLLYGNVKALSIHKDFLKGDRNRSRKLSGLIQTTEQIAQQNDIVTDSLLYGNVKALSIHKDFLKGDRNRSRKLSGLIRKCHKADCSLLHAKKIIDDHGSPVEMFHLKTLSEKQKWDILQQTPTELSIEEIKRRMSDRTPILRRKATDPLPCRTQRPPKQARIRYEDEDEENCWDQILPGGREETAKLTLEDRLLLPASIRSNHPLSKYLSIIYHTLFI
jgi:hypothetical protein